MKIFVVGGKTFTDENTAKTYAQITAIGDAFMGGYGIPANVNETTLDEMTLGEAEDRLEKLTEGYDIPYKKGYGIENWKNDRYEVSKRRVEEYKRTHGLI